MYQQQRRNNRRSEVYTARRQLEKTHQGHVPSASEGREKPASDQVERLFRSVLQKVSTSRAVRRVTCRFLNFTAIETRS